MAYPYPPHHPDLPYTGKQHYFLTFCTNQRWQAFTESGTVDLVLAQFLRAAGECRVEIPAYCFMPDHVHFVAKGLIEQSDCKAFIKAAKQYTGYYFKQKHRRQLWQRYGFDRVIRDDVELAFAIGYIVANPVRSGLVNHPSEYPYLGSQCYTVLEMLEICQYSEMWV